MGLFIWATRRQSTLNSGSSRDKISARMSLLAACWSDGRYELSTAHSTLRPRWPGVGNGLRCHAVAPCMDGLTAANPVTGPDWHGKVRATEGDSRRWAELPGRRPTIRAQITSNRERVFSAGVGKAKRVCSTSLHHSRQCSIVLKLCSYAQNTPSLAHDTRLQPKIAKTI